MYTVTADWGDSVTLMKTSLNKAFLQKVKDLAGF